MNSPHRATTPLHDLLEEARAAVSKAASCGPDTSTLEVLRRCVQGLEVALGADLQPVQAYDGFIDYTLDDEQFESHFRQFDLRVYYRWEDYDRNDEPFADWGAQIEHCEVLAVRYFDEAGNEVSIAEYHLEEALNLVEARHELVTEACTADGYRHGVGQSHPLYSAATLSPGPGEAIVPRMAPSSRTRTTQQDRRNFG